MSEKKKHNQLVLILLTIFLGDYGVHQFVLGNKRDGFFYLVGSLSGYAILIINSIDMFKQFENVKIGDNFLDYMSRSYFILSIIMSIIFMIILVFKIIDIIKIATGKVFDADGNSLIEGY